MNPGSIQNAPGQVEYNVIHISLQCCLSIICPEWKTLLLRAIFFLFGRVESGTALALHHVKGAYGICAISQLYMYKSIQLRERITPFKLVSIDTWKMCACFVLRQFLKETPDS